MILYYATYAIRIFTCTLFRSKLGVHFPHRVDHKSGKAQWDSEKDQLTVTVPLRREYDFLNVDPR